MMEGWAAVAVEAECPEVAVRLAARAVQKAALARPAGATEAVPWVHGRRSPRNQCRWRTRRTLTPRHHRRSRLSHGGAYGVESESGLFGGMRAAAGTEVRRPHRLDCRCRCHRSQEAVRGVGQGAELASAAKAAWRGRVAAAMAEVAKEVGAGVDETVEVVMKEVMPVEAVKVVVVRAEETMAVAWAVVTVEVMGAVRGVAAEAAMGAPMGGATVAAVKVAAATAAATAAVTAAAAKVVAMEVEGMVVAEKELRPKLLSELELRPIPG